MLKNKFFSFTILFFLLGNTALALPIMTSGEDQNFTKNYSSTQFYDLKITEDPGTNYLKAGTIKITIPDTIEFIFDSKRTSEEILLYGTAVNNGRIDQKPKVTFEDADKSIVLPLKQNFGPSEYVVITHLFGEGFHSQPAASVKLKLTLADATEVSDLFSKYIQTSSTEDSNAPDVPTAVTITDSAEGLMLSWKDPTDLDLKIDQIFKGKNGSPLTGPIAEIAKGVQEYNDKSVVKGETIEYQLKAFDGLNYSIISPKVSYVVGSGSPNPSPNPTPPIETQQTTQENTQQTTQEVETCQASFVDVKTTDADCLAIAYLKENNIVNGYSDGTFQPEKTINRAELLKVVLLMFKKQLISANVGFKDVIKDAWYMPYLATAKALGIIQGYPDNTVKPDQIVINVEAMKIISLASGKQLLNEVSVPPFNNTPLGSWYLPYVQFFKDSKIELGDEQGNIMLDKKMTRGEIAEILYKVSKL